MPELAGNISLVRKGGGAFRSLGNYLRAAREARNLTQKELAKRAHLRSERVSEMENGSNARLEQYDKYARGLGFKGVLEFFVSGGDPLTMRLLRYWRVLEDDQARKDALTTMRGQIVSDAERDAT